MSTSNHYFTERPKSKPRFGMIYANLRGISFKFLTASGVFSKKRVDLGTRLLIESMLLPENGYVLDMGCGYGAVGIVAAVLNPSLRVIMVDVNERAVKLAKKNAKINNAKNVTVKRSRLYDSLKGFSFNCVLSNPPVSAGMETVKAIIVKAPEYMAKQATFQIVLKSKICGKRLCDVMENVFGNVNILARKSGYRVLISEKQ